jgi:DNA polymerase delta subunit 2
VFSDFAQLSIPPPPPKQKFYSDDDCVMIEDESGRIRLVGERLKEENLVTGVIIGALGIENNNGEFEVVDFCFPGMPPQPSISLDEHEDDEMDVDGEFCYFFIFTHERRLSR